MKEMYVKIIPAVVFVFLCLLSFVFQKEDRFSSMVFLGRGKLEEKVNEILKENEEKTVVSNQNVRDKFVYLAFQQGDDFSSFFVDVQTGEEKEFSAFLKEDCRKDFFEKEKELLYLKYPEFVVAILLGEDVIKNYQISENELVIHYSNISSDYVFSTPFYLRINYNEIKDFLDFPVFLDQEYENENGFVLDKNKKAIALTFDDGPSGSKTNRIVELLEQNKAHATFFMVGNRMESGESVIRNVIQKGNEIGSHSYAHKNMKRQKIADIVSGEEKTKEIYRSITGKELIYTRPPYGNVNAAIKQSLATVFITWNIDTEDWLHRDKEKIVNHVMEHVEDGDIILMHDVYDSTVAAVEELLPKLYAAGYQVVTISELAELKGRTLEQHSLYRSLKEIE